ncbi:baseplate J/gp47 family protein [Nocardioides sp. cx-169]|uniref:baseplate J/gp47 family protein n=1 Tax=Nocardioides sp. cx-169 TaxID=2899080 RepID=UPI001E28B3EE|nr:baseplate J/gp47 family protein [Nocardioides sp. cx-169]MCD4536373.1 baseplate J/gp47 family protein [Nocardioides sp. cx-169]
MTGLLDPRDRALALRELASLARTTPAGLPDRALTWHDLLFAGDALADPSRPDQALLSAVAELTAGLADHLAGVPDRLHREWLAEILGIPEAPAEADRVPVGFTTTPAAGTVLVPRETELRAKDTAGRERRYLTAEPLEVHGTTVPAVRAARTRRLADGAVADTAVRWADREEPFAGFVPAPGETGVPTARHRLRIADQLLATDGSGSTTVTVSFVGGDASVLGDATWRRSTAEGSARAYPSGSVVVDGATTRVTVTYGGACAAPPGETLPWLEVALPRTAPLDGAALGLSFTQVELEVQVRGLAPTAAFAGDARLDLSKAFEPFGPVPREGDALVVRSDEAFGKPLTRLAVDVGRAGSSKPGDRADDHLAPVPRAKGRSTRKTLSQAGSGSATLVLEAWDGAAWEPGSTPITSTELVNVAGVPPLGTSVPASAVLEYAGQRGHFVRLRLDDADFGWQDHQRALAELAAVAGTTGTRPSAARLAPPEAPRLERLRLAYTTVRRRAAAVTSYDGYAVRRQATGGTGTTHAAFRTTCALGTERDVGTLDVALDLPDRAVGGSVSLWLEVRPADVGAEPGASRWQISTASGWRTADVADGTHGLRQSGLLRVLAPAAWTRGAPEAGDPDGTWRWLRLHSSEPGRLGTLLAIVPDAALAAQCPRPALVAPEEALLPAQVKGLVSPVAGVRKVAGLRGLPGRAAESPADYRRRASTYHRHRDRAVQAWDYEELARQAAPGVAAVRCLPHTCAQLGSRPGSVALVVVPAGSQPQPLPTVAMAERIESALRSRMPVTATVAVVPPAYVAVTVRAHVALATGVAALQGRARVLDGLERWLHPALDRRPRFGSGLYASAVVSFLESLAEVDHVVSFGLTLADGTTADPVAVDPARGLAASSGRHAITVEERP